MSDADRSTSPAPGTTDEYVVDEQTGKQFPLRGETPLAVFAASVSAVYLVTVIFVFIWLSIATLTSNRFDLRIGDVNIPNPLPNPLSGLVRLFAVVALAGALGGAVDGLRSLVLWHAERKSYGARFFWKYLSRPFVGAALGLIAFALAKGGASAVSGELAVSVPENANSGPTLLTFAVGALAGFSSEHVFRWFDAQANSWFSVMQGSTIAHDEAETATREAREFPEAGHSTGGEPPKQLDGQVDGDARSVPGSTTIVGAPVGVTSGTEVSASGRIAKKATV
jgi:hypothetical protein